MNKELPKFRGVEYCPKCGTGASFSRRYTPLDRLEGVDVECMRTACPICGYGWLETCADYKPVAVVPPPPQMIKEGEVPKTRPTTRR